MREMADYQLGVPLKGKPLAEKDGYEVYQEGSDMSVYGVWEEDGVKYGQHRGYLANLENFESVVGELQHEVKVMMQEFREEFGL
jgi:hypothetical protein